MYTIFFFKEKAAYELRISDWSSDVCSTDLTAQQRADSAQRRQHYQQRMTGVFARLRIEDVEPPHEIERPPPARANRLDLARVRSAERRVGKECVSTFRSRWSTYH